MVALQLMLLELVVLHTLSELKRLEPALVSRIEIEAPRAQILLQVQIECILLLFEMKPAMRPGNVRGVRAGAHQQQRTNANDTLHQRTPERLGR